MKIEAIGPPDQARMIDIVARIRAAAGRSQAVVLSDGTGWPRKGESISVVMTSSGQMKKIQGTVVELEPRTATSAGRMLVQDSTSGNLVELPAPVILGE